MIRSLLTCSHSLLSVMLVTIKDSLKTKTQIHSFKMTCKFKRQNPTIYILGSEVLDFIFSCCSYTCTYATPLSILLIWPLNRAPCMQRIIYPDLFLNSLLGFKTSSTQLEPCRKHCENTSFQTSAK